MHRMTTLAIDCGGGGIKASVLDEAGTMRAHPIRVPTPYPLPTALFVKTLTDLAGEVGEGLHEQRSGQGVGRGDADRVGAHRARLVEDGGLDAAASAVDRQSRHAVHSAVCRVGILLRSWRRLQGKEASPSPVYGAALLMRFGS